MQRDVNWFSRRVNVTPNRVAVIDSQTNDAWTYKQLEMRVEILASYFLAEGVQKGDRIAILAPNHLCYFDFLFAAMKIGAIFVPLNWRLADVELEYIIHDAKPKIIGTTPLLRRKLTEIDTDALFIEIIANDYLDKITAHAKTVDLELGERDPLVMIYTGGTTGRPKGVVLSHHSILWNAINTIISWNLTQEDITLTALPMFHTGGLNVFTLPLLLIGGKVVITAEFKAEKAVEDLLAYQCTTALFVPTMYHMMVQTKIFQQSSFPDMNVFVSGGAPCPPKIYEAFAKKGIAFKEGYGLTEAGPNNFYIDPEMVALKTGSVGRPMIFNDIKIVREDNRVAAINEVGELIIRGNHSFEFYWNNPVQTEKTIVDGWIYTGDLARQDEDGYVYIVGRKKDMIITGGENVYPLEVEYWLESHEAISEAAVIGIPDEKWGEKVIAFVVLKHDMTAKKLADYCNQKLARYKVPKHFIILDELPKTHVGKIDKINLRKRV